MTILEMMVMDKDILNEYEPKLPGFNRVNAVLEMQIFLKWCEVILNPNQNKPC